MKLTAVTPTIFVLASACGSAGGTPSDKSAGVAAEENPAAATAANPTSFRPETAADPNAPLVFAWPVPSRATVRDEAVKKGVSAVTRYDIALSKSSTEGEYLLELSDFEFLEMNGQKVTGALAERLAPVVAVAALIPPMRISPNGAYLGPPAGFHLDTLLRKMRKDLFKDTPAEVWQGLETMLRDPAVEAASRKAAGDFWRAWVEAWVGFDLQAGEQAAAQSEIPLGDGKVSTASVTLWNDGPDKTDPALLRLRLTSIQDNEALRNFTIAAMLKAVQGSPEAAAQMKAFSDTVRQVRISAEITAVTERSTLRPREVFSKETTAITTADGKTRSQVQSHRYRFEWR